MKKLILISLLSLLIPTPKSQADVYIYGGGQLVGIVPSTRVFQVISFSNRAQALVAYYRLRAIR